MSLVSKRQMGETRRAGPAGFPAKVATRDYHSEPGSKAPLVAERPGSGSAVILQRGADGLSRVVGVTDYPGPMPSSVAIPLSRLPVRADGWTNPDHGRVTYVHPELAGDMTPDEKIAGKRGDVIFRRTVREQVRLAVQGDTTARAWVNQVRRAGQHVDLFAVLLDAEGRLNKDWEAALDALDAAAPAAAKEPAAERKPRSKAVAETGASASGVLDSVAARAGTSTDEINAADAAVKAAAEKVAAAKDKVKKAKGKKAKEKACEELKAARAEQDAVQDRYDDILSKLAAALGCPGGDVQILRNEELEHPIPGIPADTLVVAATVQPRAPRVQAERPWRDPQVACRALATLRTRATVHGPLPKDHRSLVVCDRDSGHSARRRGYSVRSGLVSSATGCMAAVELAATYKFLGWCKGGARIQVPGCGVVVMSPTDIKANM